MRGANGICKGAFQFWVFHWVVKKNSGILLPVLAKYLTSLKVPSIQKNYLAASRVQSTQVAHSQRCVKLMGYANELVDLFFLVDDKKPVLGFCCLALLNIFKSSISTKNNFAAARVQSTQVLTKVREANGICK